MDNRKGYVGEREVTTLYSSSPEQIFNEARNADQLLVIGIKAGKPTMWAKGNERDAQELVAQFFPSAVLPRTHAEADTDR